MTYQTITIASCHWQAQIAPEYGANLVSVCFRDQDVLLPWSAERKDPFLTGAPLLLPANRTAEGKFSFAGKTYTLPINELSSHANLHGNLYHQKFQVTEQGDDRICLEYVNRGEIYPFPFRMCVRYQVGEDGLRSGYQIENLSDTAMPLTFGLHTTFVEPQQFRVPLAACQEKDEKHIPTGRYVPLNPQEKAYCTGSPSRGRVISGYYLRAGDTARIGPHLCYQVTGFDHWILYNGKGEGGFLCIEPQVGAVNGLNDPVHCPVISGRDSLYLQTRLFWDK